MYGVDHDKLMTEVVDFKRRATDRSYKLTKDSSQSVDANLSKMAFSKDSKQQMKVMDFSINILQSLALLKNNMQLEL